MNTISPYIRVIRPKHWIKNILVLVPLFFAWKVTVDTTVIAIASLVAFSATASIVYILNDLADTEADRLHPEKKFRPFAAGTLSHRQGKVLAALLVLIAIIASWTLSSGFQLTLFGYFILNLLYSFYLKRRLIIDVMILAAGFVLRVVAGGFAFHVTLSPWILLCTFFASLFIGFGKRKNETDILQEGSHKHRAVLEHYTRDFLNQLLGLTAAMTIMSYSLYTIDAKTVDHFGTDNLIYTVPFVVYGVFRYFHLMYNLSSGGDPTKIFLKDKMTIINIFCWALSFVLITNYF